MKIQVLAPRFFLCLMLIASTSFLSFGQHSSNETLLKFTSQGNGKIASLNAVSQKVFIFNISGMTTPQQVADFVNNFQGKKFVVSISVSDLIQNTNQRKGIVVLERIAKIADFQKLLTDAGISHIYVDNERIPVAEMETIKTNVPTKNK